MKAHNTIRIAAIAAAALTVQACASKGAPPLTSVDKRLSIQGESRYSADAPQNLADAVRKGVPGVAIATKDTTKEGGTLFVILQDSYTSALGASCMNLSATEGAEGKPHRRVACRRGQEVQLIRPVIRDNI